MKTHMYLQKEFKLGHVTSLFNTLNKLLDNLSKF